MKIKITSIVLGIIFTGISIVSGLFVFASHNSTGSQDMSHLGVMHHLSIEGMDQTQVQPKESPILELSPTVRFRKIQESSIDPVITAQSAIVVDFLTGDILYQKNALDRHQPASITKLLTAAVVMDEYEWGSNRYIEMSQTAFDVYGGNSLQVGDTFTIEDLIRAALIVSSNDSSQLLAEQFGGNDIFVSKMNTKAQQLGLTQSMFFNPHGLDQKPESNYSTANDISKLTQYIYDNDPALMDVLRQKETVIQSQSGNAVRLVNTNELLGVSGEMVAAKTGLTTEAGETLSSVVSIKDRILGVVVLQSDIGGYRFQDTQNLIKWVEDNYTI